MDLAHVVRSQGGHVGEIGEVLDAVIMDDVVLGVVNSVDIVVVRGHIGGSTADGIADGAGCHRQIGAQLDIVNSIAGAGVGTIIVEHHPAVPIQLQASGALQGGVFAVDVGDSNVGKAGGFSGLIGDGTVSEGGVVSLTCGSV